MKFRLALTSIISMAAILLVSCFETKVATGPEGEGNSSETVALISGKVVDKKGGVVSGVRVTLISERFNPVKDATVDQPTVTTNSEGLYEFKSIRKGIYSVEAQHPNNGTRSFSLQTKLEKSLSLIADTLKTTGNIHVTLPESLKVSGGYYYLPQTPYSLRMTEKIISQGYFDLDSWRHVI